MTQASGQASECLKAIRLIKRTRGIFGLPKVTIEADFPCRLTREDEYFYETEADYVFFLAHPVLKDALVVRIIVDLPSDVAISDIRSELCSVPFSTEEAHEERLFFEVDLGGFVGKTRSLNVHSTISEPGITLRIEHNNRTRVAPHYRNVPWPETEIAASIHYAFAAREILRHSGASAELSRERRGHFLILVFETSNPDHPDFPPHWHLIHRLPEFVGSIAPHIYLDAEGANTFNHAFVDGRPGKGTEYRLGEWCRFVTAAGDEAAAIAITADGGYSLAFPNGQQYRVSPYQASQGVGVFLHDTRLLQVKCHDDTDVGMLTVDLVSNDQMQLRETICFDTATGMVTARTMQNR